MKVGDRLALTIESLVPGGEALARHGDYVIFVPDAVPGDRVEARIISAKPQYARALIEVIEESSSDRVTPRCPAVPECGGCQWQFARPALQEMTKQQHVIDAFVRLGGFPLDLVESVISPLIGMEDPWFYRNKVQYPVNGHAGRLKAGYYKRRTHEIIPIEKCYIQADPLNAAIRAMRTMLEAERILPYDEKTGKGVIRHLTARYSTSLNQILVGLVVKEKLPSAQAIAEAIMDEEPRIVGVVENLNNKPGNAIFGSQNRLLAGEEYLIEQLGDLRFRLSLTSFFQINPLQTVRLYDKAAEFAGLTGNEVVIDAYAGTGTIALWLAKQAAEVYAIESHPAAVADGIRNAELNAIDNCYFEEGRVEIVLPSLLKGGVEPDVVVLDPPRAGCESSVLDAIAQSRISRVVYVSCNPATAARDCRILAVAGYEVTALQPVDLFPHTYHVECVIQLILKEELRERIDE